jgi:hypothetical protein
MEGQILLDTKSGTNQPRDYNVLKKYHPMWTQLDGLKHRLTAQENIVKEKNVLGKHTTSFDVRQLEAIQNEIALAYRSLHFDLLRHINIFICPVDHQNMLEVFHEFCKPDFQIVLNAKFSVFEYAYVSLIIQVIFIHFFCHYFLFPVYLILGPENDNYRGYEAEIFPGNENVASRTLYQKSGFL